MKPKVAKTTEKMEIKVKVGIRLGQTSQSQKAAWHKFWQKLIAEVKNDSI